MLIRHVNAQKASCTEWLPVHGDRLTVPVTDAQEEPKGLDKLAKRFRNDISLLKNGVSTASGLDGKSALAKFNASSAAQVNTLDRNFELGTKAGVTLEQAYDLYEAELKNNRYLCILLRSSK